DLPVDERPVQPTHEPVTVKRQLQQRVDLQAVRGTRSRQHLAQLVDELAGIPGRCGRAPQSRTLDVYDVGEPVELQGDLVTAGAIFRVPVVTEIQYGPIQPSVCPGCHGLRHGARPRNASLAIASLSLTWTVHPSTR